MSHSGFGDTHRDSAKHEITLWESEGPGFLAHIGDSIPWPGLFT